MRAALPRPQVLPLPRRYTLTWPEHYSLKVGDKFLRSGKPLAANSAQKHRSEEELRLDKHLFSNNQDITCIVLNEKHTPDKTPHFLVVLLVKTTTPEAVEARVERLGVEESKERLREYLGGGGGECEVEGLRVSLQCQYYKGEMGIPVRSKLCTSHY